MSTFDTFYEDYIEFKHYVDHFLETLNFNKELDIQPLAQTENKTENKKDIEDKILELQEVNEQLRNENKTLYKILVVLHENKSNVKNTERKYDEQKWENVTVRSNRKAVSNPRNYEQLKNLLTSFMNYNEMIML